MSTQNFAEFLKHTRLKAGYEKISYLSKSSGVPQSTLSRLENADQSPSIDTLRKLGPALNRSYEEMLVAAGYLETVIDHGGFKEFVITDSTGNVIDIIQELKELPKNKEPWLGTAFRAASELSETELNQLEKYANFLIKEVQDKKKLSTKED